MIQSKIHRAAVRICDSSVSVVTRLRQVAAALEMADAVFSELRSLGEMPTPECLKARQRLILQRQELRKLATTACG